MTTVRRDQDPNLLASNNHDTNDMMMYSTAAADAVPDTPGAMSDMNAGSTMGVVSPELGMQAQMGFDPENVFALGNMLYDGFYFPMTLDGNMGFF